MKHYLVTGASKGLGLLLANKLSSQGHKVSAISRTSLGDIQNIISPDVNYFSADVSNELEVSKAVELITKEDGSFDAVIHCAGVYGPFGPTSSIAFSEWERAIRINLLGTFNIIKQTRNALSPGDAKFISLSGGGATSPMPNISGYAASKAGVVRLIESVALEPNSQGITYLALAPGLMATQMLEQLLNSPPEIVGEDFHKKMRQASEEGTDFTQEALECIEFLLSANIQNGNGRLLSAVWDPWREWVNQGTIPVLPAEQFTLRREV